MTWSVVAVLCAAALASAAEGPGSAPAPDDWPGAKWDEKLTEPYEPWAPVREVLTELARRAGAGELVFAAEADETFMIPIAAGRTLRQAFEGVAAVSGLKAVCQGDRLAVQASGRRSGWMDLVGAAGHVVQVGERRGSVYLPRQTRGEGPVPWVWYAPNGIDRAHSWLMKRLLDAGIAVAVVSVGESQGNPEGRAVFAAFHDKIVAEYGLTKRAVLMPQSRGGLMLYNWAAEHPEHVAAVGGIYTVCDLRSYPGMKRAAEAYKVTEDELAAHLAEHNPIDRLAPLAKAGVRIFHVHGDKDGAVPAEKNAGELVRRYKALGGDAEILMIPGKGHEVAREYFQCRPLADFLVTEALAAAKREAPADSGKKETKDTGDTESPPSGGGSAAP